VRPVDADARGVMLCTRRYNDLTYTMLELTKDRGLAVIDVQTAMAGSRTARAVSGPDDRRS